MAKRMISKKLNAILKKYSHAADNALKTRPSIYKLLIEKEGQVITSELADKAQELVTEAWYDCISDLEQSLVEQFEAITEEAKEISERVLGKFELLSEEVERALQERSEK